tara:strand:- start:1152 stop:1436 length:285 start_codon:yes stop_codon:yes gene_type:complete
MTQTVTINNQELEAIQINTQSSAILLIKAPKGFLGCSYFNIDTANKISEAVAIVTGVKTFDDMLNTTVIQASNKAKELNITEGMTGKEALEKML